MGADDRDGRGQPLSASGRLLNTANGVHPLDDLPEGGETLAIGVPAAAEVEFGLGTKADEEVRGGGVGGRPGHGDGPIEMAKAGDGGPFESDGRETGGFAARGGARLDDFDANLVAGLVFECDGAMEEAARVMTGVDVAEKVVDGPGSGAGVETDAERTGAGVETDVEGSGP